ncbi:hypothetical protein [Asticcacaulis solisilvae]|uniref:hypothetical protein n=1 Tax=Asticcacaulis solisilvae TaxID=1217274 RepID=UPI003FD8323B
MKLPDFYNSSSLNSLRRKMGIAATQFGNLEFDRLEGRLSRDELERLTSLEGLDIESLDDIRVLDDGTLAYKNSRVLLYIRDHTVYNERPIDPKFHVVNCDTLDEMKRRRRFARYVVATKLDGTFRLNIINGSEKTSETKKLSVCQNCMNFLHFDGFDMTMPRARRYELVNAFSIGRFFEKYPKTLISDVPKHDADNAPLNDYNQDFSAKSTALRVAANWQCQNISCGISLRDTNLRKYLHVHHLNGVKSDDSASNHKVLCIACHADEPNHGHMKSLPEYREFMGLGLTSSRVSA